MTSPLPVKVPTREQCSEASGFLISCSHAATRARFFKDATIDRENVAMFFQQAAAALGLRLSADEPAQQPSDLVKRLRSISLPPSMAVVQSWITEAAARIEALEAAASQPSREAALVKALREAPCPHPAPEKTAGECFDNRNCGCIYGAALAYPATLSEVREGKRTYDTPATPDAGREEAK